MLPALGHSDWSRGFSWNRLTLTGASHGLDAGRWALNAFSNTRRRDAPAESDEAMRKGIAAGTFKSPHLKLLNPSKRVSEVLKMAGRAMFLEIHRDFKQAIASF